ncbi:MAG: hypothetical protein LRY73_06325 [Bacillus sp. (in: Bacteria)]|nr:hypothetical protein [Bacillus sp. (in: firmicutes)]
MPLRFVSTKAETEDPAGTRRLKRCPRKASSCSKNQQQRLTEPIIYEVLVQHLWNGEPLN